MCGEIRLYINKTLNITNNNVSVGDHRPEKNVIYFVTFLFPN